MAQVKIYRFEIYDGALDRLILSRRWGTREAIEVIRAIPIEDSEIEIDEPDWDCMEGLTAIGFDPQWPGSGFQTQVK